MRRLALAVSLLLPALAGAQGAATPAAPAPADPTRVVRLPAMRRALDTLRASNAWTLAQQVSICEIPAPPFKEQRRGEELKRRFEQLGLVNARVDTEGNVIAERPGTAQDAATVVISGHLDTVFPEGTDVRVKRDSIPHDGMGGGVRLTAPGIGDDCRGLATLLAVARAMKAADVRTPGTILFVGTVGEEGPGNLRGVRRLFEETLKGQVDYFISVDGTGLGLTSRGVGSTRLAVTYKGPGGHSYGAFGMPNPIHALGRAMAAIADVQVPATPKTTFNVGIISGGQTVNSIPASGTLELDMRSESPEALATLERQVRAALDRALAAEKARWPQSQVPLELEIRDIGRRPAAAPGDDTPIVRTALGAARALGFTTQPEASSTDANTPMSMNIPAITIDGGGRGRGAHSLAESYEDGPKGWLGPQWAALVAAALAGAR